jgi:PleD family two-component response regulator
MVRPEVLLAGERANPHSALARRLARWGACCNFAKSWEEVCKLLGERKFDFVVCEANLAGLSALRAVPLLKGSTATLYCSFPIEDSCLWIRVVEKGRACDTPLAWRPNEFERILRKALADAT